MPAKKPRTECCCQPVAFMMAAIVVPLGWRSMPRTVSCFEGKPLADWAGTDCACDPGLDGLVFAECGFLLRGVLAERCLLVAIRPSCVELQHLVLPLTR